MYFFLSPKDKKKPMDWNSSPDSNGNSFVPIFFGTKGLQWIASPVRLVASGAGKWLKKYPNGVLQIIIELSIFYEKTSTKTSKDFGFLKPSRCKE